MANPSSRGDGLHLTEEDLRILAFAAEHRCVIKRQIERLLGEDVSERVESLVKAGCLSLDPMFAEPPYQIRANGLAAIASDLPAPTRSRAEYKHDVGASWLWLAARAGSFGPLAHLLSERRMRSHDGVLERPPEPYAVRLGGLDRFGNERVHYPDLLLVDPRGRRLALELELTRKGHERRERILGGYGSDRRIDRVLYLVEANRGGRAIGRLLEGTAAEIGLSHRVSVQLIEPFCVIADGRASELARAARARGRRAAAPARGRPGAAPARGRRASTRPATGVSAPPHLGAGPTQAPAL